MTSSSLFTPPFSLQNNITTGTGAKKFIAKAATNFDLSFSSFVLCGQYHARTLANRRYIVACEDGPTLGNYVMVMQSSDADGDLVLCEVEVYGALV